MGDKGEKVSKSRAAPNHAAPKRSTWCPGSRSTGQPVEAGEHSRRPRRTRAPCRHLWTHAAGCARETRGGATQGWQANAVMASKRSDGKRARVGGGAHLLRRWRVLTRDHSHVAGSANAQRQGWGARQMADAPMHTSLLLHVHVHYSEYYYLAVRLANSGRPSLL